MKSKTSKARALKSKILKSKDWFNAYNPLSIGLLLLLAGCLWIGVQLYVDQLITPIGIWTHSPKTCIVNIKKGYSLREIGDTLQQDGMIRSSTLFVAYARLTGADKRIEAGTYRISNTFSMKEILSLIVGGDVLYCRVVIPEGYTTDQIGSLLVSKGMVNSIDDWQGGLENENFNYPFLDGAPPGPHRLDGFLFPATYDLYAGFSPLEILDLMLKRFDIAFTPDLQQRAKMQGMNVRQVVILASIVEREAKLPSERPIIASVFLNRLKLGMPLESCATVEYVLGKPKERLTYQDVRTPSPYNTYLHPGLPPGPISNPGTASIEAVLYPAQTSYLYFVAKGDGSHIFSTTYGEHLAAAQRYGQ